MVLPERHAGVVEDHVHAAVVLHDLSGPAVDRVAIRDVERGGGDRHAAAHARAWRFLPASRCCDRCSARCAPSEASVSASARPMPEPAPVMAATLSLNDFIFRKTPARGLRRGQGLRAHESCSWSSYCGHGRAIDLVCGHIEGANELAEAEGEARPQRGVAAARIEVPALAAPEARRSSARCVCTRALYAAAHPGLSVDARRSPLSRMRCERVDHVLDLRLDHEDHRVVAEAGVRARQTMKRFGKPATRRAQVGLGAVLPGVVQVDAVRADDARRRRQSRRPGSRCRR